MHCLAVAAAEAPAENLAWHSEVTQPADASENAARTHLAGVRCPKQFLSLSCSACAALAGVPA